MKPRKPLLTLSICALMLGGGILWAKHRIDVLSFPVITGVRTNITDTRAVNVDNKHENTPTAAPLKLDHPVVTTVGVNPCDPELCHSEEIGRINTAIRNLETQKGLGIGNEGLIRAYQMKLDELGPKKRPSPQKRIHNRERR